MNILCDSSKKIKVLNDLDWMFFSAFRLSFIASPEFCDLRERVGLQRDRRLARYAEAKPFRALKASNNILKNMAYLKFKRSNFTKPLALTLT